MLSCMIIYLPVHVFHYKTLQWLPRRIVGCLLWCHRQWQGDQRGCHPGSPGFYHTGRVGIDAVIATCMFSCREYVSSQTDNLTHTLIYIKLHSAKSNGEVMWRQYFTVTYVHILDKFRKNHSIGEVVPRVTCSRDVIKASNLNETGTQI